MPGKNLTSNFATVATLAGSYTATGQFATSQSAIPLCIATARTSSIEVPVDNWNPEYRGILLYLVVTASGGTGITMKVQALAPGQTAAIGGGPTGASIAAAAAAVTAAGTTSLAVYPTAIAGYTTNVNSILPPKLAVHVLHSDATAQTYTIYGYGLR